MVVCSSRPHAVRMWRALLAYDRKDGQDTFWFRTPSATIAITDPKQRDQVIARRWGTPSSP